MIGYNASHKYYICPTIDIASFPYYIFKWQYYYQYNIQAHSMMISLAPLTFWNVHMLNTYIYLLHICIFLKKVFALFLNVYSCLTNLIISKQIFWAANSICFLYVFLYFCPGFLCCRGMKLFLASKIYKYLYGHLR